VGNKINDLLSVASADTVKSVWYGLHVNTAWFKKTDSISYIYISWTIHGMWMIYIRFERGGPKFSNTTTRALA